MLYLNTQQLERCIQTLRASLSLYVILLSGHVVPICRWTPLKRVGTKLCWKKMLVPL